MLKYSVQEEPWVNLVQLTRNYITYLLRIFFFKKIFKNYCLQTYLIRMAGFSISFPESVLAAVEATHILCQQKKSNRLIHSPTKEFVSLFWWSRICNATYNLLFFNVACSFDNKIGAAGISPALSGCKEICPCTIVCKMLACQERRISMQNLKLYMKTWTHAKNNFHHSIFSTTWIKV